MHAVDTKYYMLRSESVYNTYNVPVVPIPTLLFLSAIIPYMVMCTWIYGKRSVPIVSTFIVTENQNAVFFSFCGIEYVTELFV